jgi:glyoxylase-like metal-dependent hydrolase (beta-lactamase superfamily II)
MQIINLFPGSYGSNCYLIEDNGHALIIDPSASAASILNRLREDGCTPDAVILTHGHFDHIMSIDTLRKAEPNLQIYIHENDAPMLTDAKKNAFALFFRQDRVWNPADVLMTDGQIIPVGSAAFRVIHTPGHSPGSICLLCEEESVMITGDTLFADNIGRSDLWEGDFQTLLLSLKALRTYNPALTIYPGHGPSAVLGGALDTVFYM